MRDDVAMQRRLSLARIMRRVIPDDELLEPLNAQIEIIMGLFSSIDPIILSMLFNLIYGKLTIKKNWFMRHSLSKS